MRKIRTLIVDDEPLAREGVRMMLDVDSDISVIAECANGKEAVTVILNQKPDLVFLDVQMPEMNGFEVVEAVGIKQMPHVIFVTAYDKYAMRAFEVNALDYLLKPFTAKRFSGALERVKNQIGKEENDNLNRKLMSLLEEVKPSSGYLERIIVKDAGRVFFINVEEIVWIEAADVYVRVYAIGGQSHLVRGSIGKLEEKLDPAQFLRIHRSTIVQLKHIKELQPLFHGEYEIKLRDGTKLTSSRSYRDKLQVLLENSF
ncbi:MAG TPA: LytTR family DNA-binding domain-containing protein [Pyrinomonadaceae bacterium]|jgi:two-component system LytT family response regulator